MSLPVSWAGPEEELLDVKVAAALLTVKPSTLAAWAREGRVPVVRLGPRATRWTRSMLREIVAQRVDRGHC
jgi:predicted DNA-binding transcriptional regulator AlpA